MIRAEMHSDGYHATVLFDAEPWFRRAQDADIQALADADWGANDVPDKVVLFVKDVEGYEDIRSALAVCEILSPPGTIGFDCHVHAPDALRWIQQHRPGLIERLRATHPDTDATLRSVAPPPWEGDRRWAGAYVVQEESPSPSPGKLR